MITTAILDLFYYFLILVLSPLLLLPDVSLPSQILNAVNQASSVLHIIDVIIPIATLIAVVALFLVIEGAVFGYKIIKWVYTKIPGIT